MRIDPLASPNNCYPNCVAKAEKDGGTVILGWRKTYLPTNTRVPLVAVFAHHAVWEDLDGNLIDITDSVGTEIGTYDHAIIKRIEIEFVIDQESEFVKGKALPDRFIPVAPDTWGLLRRACDHASKANIAYMKADGMTFHLEQARTSKLLNDHWNQHCNVMSIMRPKR